MVGVVQMVVYHVNLLTGGRVDKSSRIGRWHRSYRRNLTDYTFKRNRLGRMGHIIT